MKFWWKGEPIISGSLRARVIRNDLANAVKNAVKEIRANQTIDDVVALAHRNGLKVEISIVPKRPKAK